MRKFASALAIAALSVGNFAFTSENAAEELEFHLNDVSGDANAINGQGFVTGGPDNEVTPVQNAPADIHGIRFVTVSAGPVVTGVAVEFHLGAVPGPTAGNMIYRATGLVGSCELDIQAQGGVEALVGTVRVREGCGVEIPPTSTGGVSLREGISVEVLEEGTGIAVIVTREDPALSDIFKKGTKLTGFTAHSRSFLGMSGAPALTIPAWDNVEDPTFTKWTIGD